MTQLTPPHDTASVHAAAQMMVALRVNKRWPSTHAYFISVEPIKGWAALGCPDLAADSSPHAKLVFNIRKPDQATALPVDPAAEYVYGRLDIPDNATAQGIDEEITDLLDDLAPLVEQHVIASDATHGPHATPPTPHT